MMTPTTCRFPKILLSSGSILFAGLLVAGCSTSAPASPAMLLVPTAVPSPSEPSQTASAGPGASVTPTLTAAASPGRTFHVQLENETGRDVTIEVTDESGLLIDAASGTPGDGASVPQNEVVVANDDASTLRLTWAGPPCANEGLLVIDATASRFTIVQPECTGDAIAFDRVLILTFSGNVAATDLEAVIQTGVDTPG
jgi:hypothetical protein